MRTETYYEPTTEDLREREEVENKRVAEFESHPAYQYALLDPSLDYESCEMFAAYTNKFRSDFTSFRFSQPMDDMMCLFKREYMGGNW